MGLAARHLVEIKFPYPSGCCTVICLYPGFIYRLGRTDGQLNPGILGNSAGVYIVPGAAVVDVHVHIEVVRNSRCVAFAINTDFIAAYGGPEGQLNN